MKKLYVITIALVMSGTISSLTYSMDEGWDTQKTYYITREEKTPQIIPQTGITKPTTTKPMGLIISSPSLLASPQDRLVKGIEEKNLDMVKKALNEGADIEKTEKYLLPDIQVGTKMTPLSIAAKTGNDDIIKYLLSKGAKINAIDKTFGYSPLMIAAARGHLETVKNLIEAGADRNLKNDRGETAFDLALKKELKKEPIRIKEKLSEIFKQQ